MSFIFVGIYWNNHHHMLRASVGIDGASMWANLHLLFWLSVVPFGTAWLGKYPNAAVPVALYGFNLLMCAVAYTILQQLLLSLNGPDTRFARALRVDVKGRLSLALYVCSIALAFVYPLAAEALFVVVAIIWVVPDRRFEPAIEDLARCRAAVRIAESAGNGERTLMLPSLLGHVVRIDLITDG